MRQQAEVLKLHQPDALLPAYRELIDKTEDILRRYHQGGGSGLRVAHCRSMMMDAVMENLYERGQSIIRKQYGSALEVTLFALGGFGRAELSPFSDIDIMFLYPQKSRDAHFADKQRAFNDAVLYMLWDLNKKVGHSTRTIKETLQEAGRDVQSKNAMLEARCICGSEKLSAAFEKEYNRFLRRDDVPAYLEERLRDQTARRLKYGGSVFRQEPDIKNGVGGLRDFQNVLWMVRLKLATREIGDRLSGELLQEDEFKEFVAAYDFLLRVRNELHLQSKKPTELLNLDRQPKIAWLLGYRQRNIFQRVETFMRDYYRAAQAIFRISEYLEQRLFEDSRTNIPFAEVIEARRHQRREIIDGFVIRNRILFALNNNVFEDDPSRLVRVFRHLQRLETRPDFELIRHIRTAATRVDPKKIRTAEASKSFRSITQTAGNVYTPLRWMNETGVLSLFLPEWKNLHCLVQHEFYHRYTADEHTLRTILELDEIFKGTRSDETTKYRESLMKTEHPTLLYMVLLLHDIGKGMGVEGHQQAGAEMAVKILDQLDLPVDLRKKIIFLIGHHLEMARIWQRLDIDDAETIQSFAKWVGNKEKLHYLYALTYCDAKGTSQDLWNGFKDAQHTRLYRATLNYFDQPMAITSKESFNIPGKSIREKTPEIASDEVDAHFNLMPDRYYIYHNEDEIVLHLRMVHRLLKTIAEADSLGALVPVVEWHDDLNLDLTVVNVVTWDRAGLFYKLAGAFSLAGLNIISSKALTRADHITIDTFYVTDSDGGFVSSNKSFDVFQSYLKDALLHNKDLMTELEKKSQANIQPSYLLKQDHLPASIPAKVDIYHELSLRRTIIEVQCNDEIGLLYRLTKAIYDHGFDITFGRISTERHVVADTFYIEPIQPNGKGDSSPILELRRALEAIVQSVNPI